MHAENAPPSFQLGCVFGAQLTEDGMDMTNTANVQQTFGLAIQKSALETQANMVSKLFEGASVGLQQPSQAEAGLRVDALADRGIGTRLDLVA